MFCNKCGQELRDGAKFCNHCGAPVDEFQVGKTKRRFLIPVIAAVLLIAAALVVYFSTRPANENTSISNEEPEQIAADKNSGWKVVKETHYWMDGEVNQWVEYEYDKSGKLVAEVDYDTGYGDDPDAFHANRIEFKYDKSSQTGVWILYSVDSSTETDGRIEWECDENMNPVRGKLILNYHGEDELYQTWVQVFDDRGNRIELNKYDSNGSLKNSIRYTYDSQGFLTQIVFMHEDLTDDNSTTHTYTPEVHDEHGNVVRASYSNTSGNTGYVEYEYDYFG